MSPRELLRLADGIEPRRRKVPKFKPAEKPKKLTRKELVAAVRPKVEARAAGCCEACWIPFGVGDFTPEWDEFFGRRPQDITVEKTWMLCRACHRAKTENNPTRYDWDCRFARHCTRHGYMLPSRLTKDIRRRAP